MFLGRYIIPALLLAQPLMAQSPSEPESLAQLKQQAEAGDLHATQQLYMRHAIEGRTEQARAWATRYNEQLTKLAKGGNTRAMMQLGSRHLTGADYTAQNTEQAVVWFSRAAEAGEPAAAYVLGEIFAKQGNVPMSTAAYERAYSLYTKRDDPEALYWLGYMEQHGIGTERKAEAGIAKLTLAAERGSAWAASQLFKTYYDGVGTARDVAKAIGYARKLADEQHDGTMAYVAATALIFGQGVAQDEELGEHYLDLAVQANTPDAIYMKANRLEATGKMAEAIPLFRQAASMHQREGLVRMGALLLHGAEGVEQDEPKGLAMLELAANRLDSPQAAWELARYYDSVDAGEAADSWYITAAQRGVAQAMARRGVLHLIPGSGVSWSPTETYRWWRLGKAAQDPTCTLYLHLFHFGFIPLLLILVFGLPAYYGHRMRRKLRQG